MKTDQQKNEDLIIALHGIDTRIGMWAAGMVKNGASASDVKEKLRSLVEESGRK